MEEHKKSFWLWSAVFLWIWSMVWAWIFVLLWEAWSIAWNLVWVSFILWWIIALLSWYSLAKLAWAYPSRWWIVEYLVQCYWEWVFSWTLSVLFYLSAMIAIAMVAKTFWTYWAAMFGLDPVNYANNIAVWVLLFFVWINLLWSSLIAKSENYIVIFKLIILVIFTFSAMFYIQPHLLQVDVKMPVMDILSSLWLAFFAFEWFRVITNTAEDMPNPKKTIMQAMIIAIILVMVLYILVSVVVFWNLPLDSIMKAKDYALAEAAKPVFGQVWFTIMAIAALVSTSSSINANLYAVTNVSYNMAKNWELPKIYTRRIYNNNEWLVISSLFIIAFILFFDLSSIASIWAVSMLFIHLIVHIWHLFKIKHTWASKFLVYLAILTITLTIIISYNYMSGKIPNIWYMLLGSVVFAFLIEVTLRLLTKRVIKKQIV